MPKKCDWCGKVFLGEGYKAKGILDEEEFCNEQCANLAAEDEERYQFGIWLESCYQEYLALPFQEDLLKEEWTTYFDPTHDITWEVGTTRRDILGWFDEEYEDGLEALQRRVSSSAE